MKDYLYIGSLLILISVCVFLSVRTSRQTTEIKANKKEIKSYGRVIDSLSKEQMKKEKLLKEGLENEKTLAVAVAKTDSFNLILKKKIRQYEKPDFSHVTSDSAILLLSNRANRYRSIK